jgi:SAM-dependent methyltransferase
LFKKFDYIPNYQYTSGWDKYALDYQNLLVKDTIYYLTKEIIHRMIDKTIKNQNKDITVLDVNCGTGNDFPFFFDRGWHVVGCDGSQGMLNKAYEKYNSEIKKGKLTLYQGMIESLETSDFKHNQFDFIFSVTGGFAYVNDQQLEKINRKLVTFLKPGGKLVVAHLNRFCLPEFLHRIYKIKNPFLRSGKTIKVKIKNEEYEMYLRSANVLRKLYSPVLKNIKIQPLLAITPPYQTGFRPGKSALKLFKGIETALINLPLMNVVADQVVIIGEKTS